MNTNTTTQRVIEVKVERVTSALMSFKAYPTNSNARYACMLVKRDYLIQEELVILQKLGFKLKQI